MLSACLGRCRDRVRVPAVVEELRRQRLRELGSVAVKRVRFDHPSFHDSV